MSNETPKDLTITHHTFLIVDQNSEIRSIIALSLESQFRALVLEAGNAATASELLAKHPEIEAVILAYESRTEVANDPAKAVYDSMQAGNDSRPVIVYTEYPGSAQSIFSKRPVITILQKPDIVRPLRKAIQSLLERSKSGAKQPDPYCRIPIGMVLRLGVLFCDLYVKLSDHKYVKVFNASDRFDTQDLRRFQQRNVSHLHIRIEDSERYLDHVVRVLSSLPSNIELDQAETFALSESAIEVISSISQMLGFTDEAKRLTRICVQMTVRTIERHPVLRELWTRFTIDRETYIASHSMALAHVACGVASLMDWVSDITFYKLCMAAFLHDITLTRNDLAMYRTWTDLLSNRGELTEAEFNAVLEHPDKAAALAIELGDIPPDIDTILRQHHERPDGSGFPKSLKAEDVHALSAVFILAHELIDDRYRNANTDTAKYLDNMPAIWLCGPFKDVIKALTAAHL